MPSREEIAEGDVLTFTLTQGTNVPATDFCSSTSNLYLHVGWDFKDGRAVKNFRSSESRTTPTNARGTCSINVSVSVLGQELKELASQSSPEAGFRLAVWDHDYGPDDNVGNWPTISAATIKAKLADASRRTFKEVFTVDVARQGEAAPRLLSIELSYMPARDAFRGKANDDVVNTAGFSRAWDDCYVGHDWARETPEFEPAGAYARGFVNGVAGTATESLFRVIGFANSVVSGVGNVFGDEEIDIVEARTAGLVKAFKDEIANLPAEDRELRAACMSHCAAHALIRPTDDPMDFSKTRDAIKMGKGDCSEYSRIAEYFATQLGLRNSMVANAAQGHMYNSVYSPGRGQWYYYDAAIRRCIFYDPNDKSPSIHDDEIP